MDLKSLIAAHEVRHQADADLRKSSTEGRRLLQMTGKRDMRFFMRVMKKSITGTPGSIQNRYSKIKTAAINAIPLEDVYDFVYELNHRQPFPSEIHRIIEQIIESPHPAKTIISLKAKLQRDPSPVAREFMAIPFHESLKYWKMPRETFAALMAQRAKKVIERIRMSDAIVPLVRKYIWDRRNDGIGEAVVAALTVCGRRGLDLWAATFEHDDHSTWIINSVKDRSAVPEPYALQLLCTPEEFDALLVKVRSITRNDALNRAKKPLARALHDIETEHGAMVFPKRRTLHLLRKLYAALLPYFKKCETTSGLFTAEALHDTPGAAAVYEPIVERPQQPLFGSVAMPMVAADQ